MVFVTPEVSEGLHVDDAGSTTAADNYRILRDASECQHISHCKMIHNSPYSRIVVDNKC